MTSQHSDTGRDVDKPEPSPEVRKAAKLGLVFVLLLLGALLAAALRLPFSLAAGVLAVLALIWAVRYIIAAIKAKRPSTIVFAGFGIVASGWILLTTLSMAVLYPVQAQYEECQASALTQFARVECRSQYQSDLADWFKKLTGQELVWPGSSGS